MDPRKLHIARGEKVLGEFSAAEIETAIDEGRMSATDNYWDEQSGKWLPLSRLITMEAVDEPASPPPPPPAPGRTPSVGSVKQGAAIGGWLCFALGVLFMWWSLWAFLLYGPLFFVSFVLSIVAMAQRRILLGVMLLLATLIAPACIWLGLANYRMGQVNQKLFGRPSPFEPPLTQNAPAPPRAPAPPPAQPATASVPSAPAAQVTPVAQVAHLAPTPDPTATEQAAIERILQESIADTHASEIRIAHTNILARDVPSVPHPVFSSDGQTVTYPQESGQAVTIIVANLRDHSRIASWKPPAVPTALGWSPDGKRLAYKAGQTLHIVEWETRKDILVPLSTFFGGEQERLVWIGSEKLACVDDYYRTIYTLDLDSLKVTTEAFQRDEAALQRQLAPLLKTSRSHPYCKIFQKQLDSTGLQDARFLFVGEQDDSFSHALVPHFYFQTPFYVSPDLRHILIYEKGVLTHLILGRRNAPEITFRIALNNEQLLDGERRAKFQTYLDKGVPFWGKVYAPLINPLNGKLIGPDPKYFKGFVRVAKWESTDALVNSSTEVTPLQPGDIVTDIASEQWGVFGNWPFAYEGQWRPLLSTTDTVGVESTERKAPVEQIAKSNSPSEAPVQVTPAHPPVPSAPTAPPPAPASSAAALPGEQYPQTRLQLLRPEDIQNWSPAQLRYAINEMYARRGADFRERDLRQAFTRFNWYHPQPGTTFEQVETSFTPVETANLKLLGAFRDARKRGVDPIIIPSPTNSGAGIPPASPATPPPVHNIAPGPRYAGRGRVYKVPELKDLVGRKLDNAWLYGDFLLKGAEGNNAFFITTAIVLLPKEGSTQLQVEFPGGIQLSPAAINSLHDPMLVIPVSFYERDPMQLLSVGRTRDGKLFVKGRARGALML